MKYTYSLFVAAVAVLFLSGCATRYVDSRVSFVDQNLSYDIDIKQVSSAVNKGGLLEIQLTGFNKKSFDKNIEYRIEWLDKNGFAIKTISTKWTRYFINKKSEFRIGQVGPNESASDFRIQLRNAR
jgi:uncharacterized protein YcfL